MFRRRMNVTRQRESRVAVVEILNTTKTLQGYVVFEREAREFQSFHIFMFQLSHKNITRIAHSYRKKVTRKSTLKYKLDYDENLTRASRSNTGTQITVELIYCGLSLGRFLLRSSNDRGMMMVIVKSWRVRILLESFL